MESKISLPKKVEFAASFTESLMPDLVIINGKVITVDKDFSIAEAVAVKGEKIVAVGSSKDIMALTGKNTKILDLNDNAMLPGINDTHLHLALFGVERPPLTLDLGYPTVKSIRDIAVMVGKRAKEFKPGEWVQGLRWDPAFMDEVKDDPERRPKRQDLDPVSPDNPVALIDQSHHTFWVNSKALELAGITKDTPDPEGGVIVKDPDTGEPTGILKEEAKNPVAALIPPFSEEQQKEGILAAMDELVAQGITSVTDPFVNASLASQYNDLYNEGKFKLRMNLLLTWVEQSAPISVDLLEEAFKFCGTKTGFGNEWLRIAGYKLLADGVEPSLTAWMYEEYPGHHGVYGSLVTPGKTDEEKVKNLTDVICCIHKAGYQIGIHSCGDRSNATVIDALIKAKQEYPTKDLHHYIIHADVTRPEDIDRMAQWNIGVTQNTGIKYDVSDFMDHVIGEERSNRMWAVKPFLDKGVRLTLSSDAPVVYPSWKQIVETAILRESKASGKVSGQENCISVQEAIKAMTITPAYQDNMENIKGSIEVGKLADLCILDEDILTAEPHSISDIKTLMTIVGGKIVYDSGALSIK